MASCLSPGAATKGGISSGRPLLAVGVADHVDDDGDGEEEDVVFTGGDVDAVGVGEGEPLLGDGGDGLVVASDGVFVVGEVAGGFEGGLAVEFDGEAVAED